jgi:hypothetical protein
MSQNTLLQVAAQSWFEGKWNNGYKEWLVWYSMIRGDRHASTRLEDNKLFLVTLTNSQVVCENNNVYTSGISPLAPSGLRSGGFSL